MSTTELSPAALDELCINTLRFLSVDMVQKAESGHPGLPLGAAAMAYALWDRYLKFNPKDPKWADRDRFVLSAGHGSALIYALLHANGYDLPMEELKNFRQWNSKTPGHPEYGLTPGVEATTGPLGQGIAHAVGLAIAEAALAARFNKPDHKIVDHYTYVLASDGDLMEGISSEAGSMAGHMGLGKLIVLYDDNNITIEGDTALAFTEDRRARFAAFGWHVQRVEDGNDLAAVGKAIEAAQKVTDRPSLIEVRTQIGFGSPNKQGTCGVHGEPLGKAEVVLTKQNLGWPTEPEFYIPEEAKEHFQLSVTRGKDRQAEWQSRFDAYSKAHPELAKEFTRVMKRELPADWQKSIPQFSPDKGPVATRVASGKCINAIASALPELIGGSADLAPSTFTLIDSEDAFQAKNYAGRNLHFGIREHGMGAAIGGMALHGGVIPFGATFLVFSDYMRPPMRLAALNHLPVIYVFTHDSIGMGEDGPTHQPVEHLVCLRSVPNMYVIRPADANETAAAWQIAIERDNGPVSLILSRQKLPILDPKTYSNLTAGALKGGYVLSDAEGGKPDVTLVATGSEVHLALDSQKKLAEAGTKARVVSMPCCELFAAQSEDYRNQVVPPGVPYLSIEAGSTLGWQSYLGPKNIAVGFDRFGASAPGNTVLKEYGFTTDNICRRVAELLK